MDADKYIDLLKDKFPSVYQEHLTDHPIHLAYALINEDVRVNGTAWNKCMDCGDPYIIGNDAGMYFCSDACESATLAYMNTATLPL